MNINFGKTLRKTGMTVFLLCAVTACMGQKDAFAAGITEDGMYSYVVRNDRAELTLTGDIFDSDSGESPESISIPGHVDGYEVSGVNLGILNDVDYEKMKTRTIILDNVRLDYDEGQETSSFYMNMPNSLRDRITEITFNPNCEVSCIPPGYFAYYQALQRINIPHGTEKLGYDAFYSCTGLEEIALPDTLKVFEIGCLDTGSALKTIYYNRKDILDTYTEEQLGTDVKKTEVRERKSIDRIQISNVYGEVYVEKDYSFSGGYTFDNVSVTISGDSEDGSTEITDRLLYSYVNNRAVGKARLLMEGTYEYCGRNGYDFTISYVMEDEPVINPTPAPSVSSLPSPGPVENPVRIGDGPTDEPDNAGNDALKSVKKLKARTMYFDGKKKKAYVYLSWRNKNRVGRYVVYRKAGGEKKYKKIKNRKYPDYGNRSKKEMKQGIYTSFLDPNVKPGKKYTYKIISASADKKRKSKAKYVSVKL